MRKGSSATQNGKITWNNQRILWNERGEDPFGCKSEQKEVGKDFLFYDFEKAQFLKHQSWIYFMGKTISFGCESKTRQNYEKREVGLENAPSLCTKLIWQTVQCAEGFNYSRDGFLSGIHTLYSLVLTDQVSTDMIDYTGCWSIESLTGRFPSWNTHHVSRIPYWLTFNETYMLVKSSHLIF